MKKLIKPAKRAVNQCLDVRKDEKVLVVTDEDRKSIGEAILRASREVSADSSLEIIEKTGGHGREPGEEVKKKMEEADVVFAPSTYSLTHTEARISACKKGTRVATLPGITEAIFRDSLDADYENIARLSEKLYRKLSKSDKVRVESPSGTDIVLKVFEKYWETDTGLIHDEGEFGNLPAGEVDGAPVEAEGKIVIDQLEMNGAEYAPPGTEVLIRNSKAVSISEDCRLSKAFQEVKNASNLAELGIGTNPEADLIGNLLQDEKVLGTCHFAFGDSSSYGTGIESEIHWDCIIKKPTIYFDGEKIMDKGNLMVDTE
ncbi:MAG: aminopeptidase [Candidatus Nanohaloarchaeota archaeon QJJ-9]|nr:aminopeptidase [Candidatus Nanohaloarchaeota archaeon QJJ-9]